MFDLMEAMVLLAEGRAAAAVDATTRADEQLTYNADMGEGILKLVVRLFKVEALAASGHADEARSLLAEVEAVNPALPAAIAARAVLGNA
jgi:hypothetical protein